MARTDAKKLRAQEKEKLRRRAEGPGRSNIRTPSEAEPASFGSGGDRATDTVIVKLRTTAAATKRFAAALRSVEGGTAAPQPFLATLVENGYAERITPVFPSAALQPAPRFGVRALSAALSTDQPVSAARGLLSVKVDPRVSADELVAHLNSLGDEVEYAYVPPVKYPFFASTSKKSRKSAKKGAGGARGAASTNDPLGARQWGHAAIKIREARARAGFVEATDIIVAVLDSGIDPTHPDLDGALHSYVNFLSGEDDRDYKGHGTHVAGIVAAEINNRVGIAGVCGARIMALKALPKAGRPWEPVAYYRALAHPITAGAKVLNLSLGGDSDRGERDVIKDVLDAGVTVVAAMGNDFERGNPINYPAAYDGVIAVGATDEVDRRASFSCTGPHISLVAPGVNVISTTPTYPSELADNVNYDSWPGTSMATPHVAAAAALLLAKRPNLTPAQVRERLTRTADRVPAQVGVPDEEYGYGRLNVAAALR